MFLEYVLDEYNELLVLIFEGVQLCLGQLKCRDYDLSDEIEGVDRYELVALKRLNSLEKHFDNLDG